MQLKITVELDEGIKATSNMKITDVAYLIDGEEVAIRQAKEGAAFCMRNLLNHFKNGKGVLHTFNQLVKDENVDKENQTYMRCVLRINDIGEIEELNKQANIPMTLEEINLRANRN